LAKRVLQIPSTKVKGMAENKSNLGKIKGEKHNRYSNYS